MHVLILSSIGKLSIKEENVEKVSSSSRSNERQYVVVVRVRIISSNGYQLYYKEAIFAPNLAQLRKIDSWL